jgi:hypothetical protein
MKTSSKKVAILILCFAGLVVVFIGLNRYQEHKSDKHELGYEAKRQWTWHDKQNRIQISRDENTKTSSLRKVYLDRNYAVYAEMNPDFTLTTKIYLYKKCTPGSKISKSGTDGNSDTIDLLCNREGIAYVSGVKWDEKNYDFVWDEKFEGFSFKEDFAKWDFATLGQEMTLLRSK